MKVTIKEFAEQQGQEIVVAGGFLRFLEVKGLATVVEKRKTSAGKGKPANVYQIADAVVALLDGPKKEQGAVEVPVPTAETVVAEPTPQELVPIA